MSEASSPQHSLSDSASTPPPTSPLRWFHAVGVKTIRFNHTLGAITLFFLRAFVMIFRAKQLPEIVQHVYHIGATSTQIVLLVGLFTGMVLGLQLYYVLIQFGTTAVLGTAVTLALIRELGPVLAAIMITARAGSAMTAEIGIQRISEQIDALYTMRIDPLGYLISPRLAAGIISFPILTAFFDLIGIWGGWLTGCVLLGVNSGSYFSRAVSSTTMEDITGGIIKSLVFAVLVVTTCCFQGFFTHLRTDSYGAKSVNFSTTSAVVLSCVMILIADYIVTSLIL